jgi:hypothetical protein
MSQVLWADDDSIGLLRSLSRFIERRGAVLTRAINYDDAIAHIRQYGLVRSDFSLLADIILPISEGRGALSPYLGIDLAREALNSGATRVAFLSVVPETEIASDLNRLVESYPNAYIRYFHKATLLEVNRISEILETLGLGGQ